MNTSTFFSLYHVFTEGSFDSKGYFVDSFCWQEFYWFILVVWIYILTLPRTDTRAPLFCLTFLGTNVPALVFRDQTSFRFRSFGWATQSPCFFNLPIQIYSFHAHCTQFLIHIFLIIYITHNLKKLYDVLYWCWLKNVNTNINFGESKTTSWLWHMIGSFDVNQTEHQNIFHSVKLC